MNRFEFNQAVLIPEESLVLKEENIKLYDGNEKVRKILKFNSEVFQQKSSFQTLFEDGELILTSHRLFWGRPGEYSRGSSILQLQLKYVKSLDEEIASSMFFGKKKRLILRLSDRDRNKMPGPMDYSTADFIKLSGPNGIDQKFIQAINEVLVAKVWQIDTSPKKDSVRLIKTRTGIGGIEKSMQERQKKADENISVAFQDLNKLIQMAKEMVVISKSISVKIRDRQSETTEDETIRFKSALMSLGIDDPVVKDNFQSGTEYLKSLGKEICQTLLDPMTESGGMMTIAEVYCRINRARGLELVSPEDVLNACRLLTGPIKLRQYPSGALILQLDNHNDQQIAEEIEREITEKESFSVEELARYLNISILLAHERLLIAERMGKVCRDESVEGLRFYQNLFI